VRRVVSKLRIAKRNVILWLNKADKSVFVSEDYLLLKGQMSQLVRLLATTTTTNNNNNRMGLQEVEGGCGDWMELAHDRER
jgi:hypothetical protein